MLKTEYNLPKDIMSSIGNEESRKRDSSGFCFPEESRKRSKSSEKKNKEKEEAEVMIKGAWSQREDDVMKRAVEKYGTDWKKIASCVRGRTAKQCRDRYKLKLDPSINHGPWTPEEDATLLSLHESMGRQWTKIAKLMKGRTENSVKSRFASLQRSKIREWTEEEDKLLWQKREEGLSNEQIAETYLPHRSVHSVKKRYERLYMRELAKKIRSEMPASLKNQSQSASQKSSFPINPKLVSGQNSTGSSPTQETVRNDSFTSFGTRNLIQAKLEIADPAAHVASRSESRFDPNFAGNNLPSSMSLGENITVPVVDPFNPNGHYNQESKPSRPKSSRQAKFKRHSTSMTVLMQVLGEPLPVSK